MATLSADRIWVPPLRGKCVAYLRASDRPYGRLNEDAQRRAICAYLPARRSALIGEFVEREPLVDGDRPALRRAVQLCREAGATLLFGRIDRMRNGVHWLGYVHENSIRFRGVDAPHINNLSYNLLVVSDLQWRKDMGERVRQAIAKSQRGTPAERGHGNKDGLRLGPEASASARRISAMKRDRVIMDGIALIRHRGITSLTGIARRLNQMGSCAPRGGSWSAAQVRSVLRKFEP